MGHNFSFWLYFIKHVFWGESASVNKTKLSCFALFQECQFQRGKTSWWEKSFWKLITSLPTTQVPVTAADTRTPHVVRTPVCYPRLGNRPCRSDFSPPSFLCPLPTCSEPAHQSRPSRYLEANYLLALLSTASQEFLFGIFYYSNIHCWLLTQRPVIRPW